jgi:integrase/recombinase XerD
MGTIRLDYVHSFIDARGQLRHTFRRKGHRQVTIKGRPGSPEFMNQYYALLDQPSSVLVVASSRAKAGTINDLVARYLKHATYTGLAKTTQVMRRQVLDNFRQCLTPGGHRYGENRLATMRRKNISDVLEGKTPNAQKNWLKTIRHLIVFAMAQGECAIDPTLDIKTARPAKSAGHMTWGDEQIAQYRERHAVGSMARLALELMLNIAARRHDAHLIGRQHLRHGCLSWRPSKTSRTTGKVLTIPVLPDLQAAFDAMPQSDSLTFLLTDYGRPFASACAFGNRFADWCKAAGLKPVVCDDGRTRNYRAHGLRKAACKQLAHAGCTGPEIMAVSGHATLTQVQVYLDGVEQDRLAETAMLKRAAGSNPAQAAANIPSEAG